MEQIALEPVDSVVITTLMDNVSDALLDDQGPAKRPPRGGPAVPRVAARFMDGGATVDALKAEHGFSAMISLTKAGKEHRILFDAGISPDGIVDNMQRMSLKPQDIEAIVMSHGHYDHTAGLDGFVRSVGRPNLPVIIHPEFWNHRRIAIPGKEPFELPSTDKASLLGAGFDIIESRQPSFLLDKSLLITGEVDRTTPYEKGYPVHQAFKDDCWQPDPLILDDQAAVLHVRDKGLVIITGCGHAGIVNIVRYAKKLTGVDEVYSVIGGFHLSGQIFSPIIPRACAALKRLSPKVVVPAHCTGWRAIHTLARSMPEAFIQNSVGTRYEL